MINVQKRHRATPRPFEGLSEVQRAGLIEEREGWRGQSEVRERDCGKWDLGEREMKRDCGQNRKRKVVIKEKWGKKTVAVLLEVPRESQSSLVSVREGFCLWGIWLTVPEVCPHIFIKPADRILQYTSFYDITVHCMIWLDIYRFCNFFWSKSSHGFWQSGTNF